MPLYFTDLQDLRQDTEAVQQELRDLIQSRASAVDTIHLRINELEREVYGSE